MSPIEGAYTLAGLTETTPPSSQDDAPDPRSPRWTSERVNRWLTLGANLGVLLGLIVLIIEVRQNASMSRLSHETVRATMLAEAELSLATPAASDAWMKAIHAPEDLTDGELRMAETQLVAIMQQWDTLFSMEKEGLVDRARIRMHIQNTAPFYFGSRFAKRWWQREELGWSGTPMFEVADPIVTAVDPNFLVETYAFLRAPFTRGIEMEAQAFMAAYGDDIRAGDRLAIAERYAESGAVMVLDGVGGHRTQEAIAARYGSGWTPPSSFEWLDLAFEPVGMNAVAVSGKFHWGSGDDVLIYAYGGVLMRENGALSIVLEDEGRIPGQVP